MQSERRSQLRKSRSVADWLRPPRLLSCFLLVILLGQTRPCLAEAVTWSIADRPDDKIAALVKKLHERFVKSAVAPEEPAVVLSNRFYINAEKSEHRICENQIIYIYDPDRGEAATRDLQFPPGREIESAGAWIYRANGKMERLQAEDIKLQEPKEGRGPGAVIAFPQVRAGDTIGWSVVLKAEHRLTGRLVRLSGEFPVKHSSLRLMTDGVLGYKLFAYNLRQGKFGSEVKEEKNGAPCDIVFNFIDIPAELEEPYCPPYVEREPYCLISLRGFYNEDLKRWLYNISWNQTALLAESMLESVGEPTGDIKQQAQLLAAGLQSHRDRADAFYRFVRDEILPVNSFEIGARLRDLDQVLANRNGTSWEKGMLLYSLCRAASIPAQIVFARSLSWGELDEDNPDLMQFSDFLIRLTTEPRIMYAPVCSDCPPGVMPFDLRGAPAMTIRSGLEDRYEEFMRGVFKATGMVEHLFMNEFEEKIKQQVWHDFFKLPGDPDEVGGITSEAIRLDPASGEAELLLHAEGFTQVAQLKREHDEIEECIQAYLSDRFETAEVLEAVRGDAADPAVENVFDFRASVQLSALPSVTGDSWILPAEQVYGAGFLDDWDGPERGPFYVEATRQFSRSWRVPLPSGWSDAVGPAPVQVEHELLSFAAEVSVRDGELVVQRRYSLKRGTVPRVRLADLDAAINRIRDVERNPLVLREAVE